MDKILRMFAGQIITDSKLSKSAKLQLLNFIQNEATDAQVKVLLMDGEIVSLDKHGEDIVNARFDVSEAGGKIAAARKSYFGSTPALQAAAGAGAAAKLAGAAASGAAGGAAVAAGAAGVGGAALGAGIWALYRKIRSAYDVCTKKCGTYEMNTVRRQYCMAKCKVGKTQADVAVATKTKDKGKINKAKVKLAKAKATFANYEKNFKSRGTTP